MIILISWTGSILPAWIVSDFSRIRKIMIAEKLYTAIPWHNVDIIKYALSEYFQNASKPKSAYASSRSND